MDEEFTGLYRNSKTVTYKLVPVGRTLETMKENDLFSADAQLAGYVQDVKGLLNQYFMHLTREALKLIPEYMPDETALHRLYTQSTADKAARKEYHAAREAEIKGYKDWTQHVLDMAGINAKKYGALFGREGVVAAWLLSEGAEGYDKDCEMLDSVSGVQTVFAKYIDIKLNVFAAQDSFGTALNRFYDNIERLWDNVAVGGETVAESTVATEEGISAYNKMISDTNEKNALENAKAKTRHPMLKKLYGQIGIAEKKVVIDEIPDDATLLKTIKDSYLEAVSVADAVYTLMSDTETGIMIKAYNASCICHDVYGRYNVYGTCLDAEKDLRSSKNPHYPQAILDNTAVFPTINSDKYLSLDDMQALINKWFRYFDDMDSTNFYLPGIIKASVRNGITAIKGKLCEMKPVVDAIHGKEDIKMIHDYMDAVAELDKYISLFYIDDKHLTEDNAEYDVDFVNNLAALYERSRYLNSCYNLVRNYMTKKPYRKNKILCNFGNPGSCLSSFVNTKEITSKAALLEKDGHYYVIIFGKGAKTGFHTKTGEVREEICASEGYRVYDYYKTGDPVKQFPKIFFNENSIARDGYPVTADLMAMHDNKTLGLPENKDAVIQYYQECIRIYPQYASIGAQFKAPSEYTTVYDFLNDAASKLIMARYVTVSAAYVDGLIADGNAYMFELTTHGINKPHSQKMSIFGQYLKTMFSDANMASISSTGKGIKLLGGAEIYLRPASMKKVITHPAGTAIPLKNPLFADRHGSVFKYDIIKDARYTQDMYSINLPIMLNPGADDPKYVNKKINDKVNEACANGEFANTIVVIRGVRNLFYYIIVDAEGHELESGSLNCLKNVSQSGHEHVETYTDYKALLEKHAAERLNATQKWLDPKTIQNFKEGYIKLVVKFIADKVMEYNAKVLIERSDRDFKKKMNIDHAIYEKLEMALISKLGNLTVAGAVDGTPGSVSMPYQLCGRYDSMTYVGKQAGIVFFQNPAYTGNMDPETGFINRLDTRYSNKDAARKFINSFSSIRFADDPDECILLDMDYTNFVAKDRQLPKNKWQLKCPHTVVSRYSQEGKGYYQFDLYDEFRLILAKNNIAFVKGMDIRSALTSADETQLYKALMLWFREFMAIHYYSATESYIVSPVRQTDGSNYDSRKESKCYDDISAGLLYRKWLVGAAGKDWLTESER
jgi:CRISPR-associated protein Cpf1